MTTLSSFLLSLYARSPSLPLLLSYLPYFPPDDPFSLRSSRHGKPRRDRAASPAIPALSNYVTARDADAYDGDARHYARRLIM